MKTKLLSINSLEIQKKIEVYLNSDCVLEKAALLLEIKTKTSLCYIDLEGYLYDEKRTLIRINSMNKLIPEILELVKTNVITKIIAYELANLSADDQFEFYLLIYELSETKKVNARKLKRISGGIGSFRPIPNNSILKFQLEGRLSGKDFGLIKGQFKDTSYVAIE